MRWYVNDVSLQGQFVDQRCFEALIRGILALRVRFSNLRTGLFTTRIFREAFVSPTIRVREAVQRSSDPDFRRAVLGWLDRNGPFTEDDRLIEYHDYFEYNSTDVTDTGLGEAARRTKALEHVGTFSFVGGSMPFDFTPLIVNHGLEEERLGQYNVLNTWSLEQLGTSAVECEPEIGSWRGLVESARRRFPHLLVPDSIYLNSQLAREPFDAVIRDRTFALLHLLNAYMSNRLESGAESEAARAVINVFFVGDRALFTGESQSNQQDFARELTFADPEVDGRKIFGHWHGKISHRFFRMHFEWPVPAGGARLKILYLGPKLTKS